MKGGCGDLTKGVGSGCCGLAKIGGQSALRLINRKHVLVLVDIMHLYEQLLCVHLNTSTLLR